MGHRKIIGELARQSLTCGIFQIAGNAKLIGILQDICAKKSLKQGLKHLELIQEECPLLVDVLLKDVNEPLICNLIGDIVKSIMLPFRRPATRETNYAKPKKEHTEL